MAPLRASTTKSEWLPDDPTAFVPTMLWKLPFITTWDGSRNQNHPTDSAEEAEFTRPFVVRKVKEAVWCRWHRSPQAVLGRCPAALADYLEVAVFRDYRLFNRRREVSFRKKLCRVTGHREVCF